MSEYFPEPKSFGRRLKDYKNKKLHNIHDLDVNKKLVSKKIT